MGYLENLEYSTLSDLYGNKNWFPYGYGATFRRPDGTVATNQNYNASEAMGWLMTDGKQISHDEDWKTEEDKKTFYDFVASKGLSDNKQRRFLATLRPGMYLNDGQFYISSGKGRFSPPGFGKPVAEIGRPDDSWGYYIFAKSKPEEEEEIKKLADEPFEFRPSSAKPSKPNYTFTRPQDLEPFQLAGSLSYSNDRTGPFETYMAARLANNELLNADPAAADALFRRVASA